MVVCGEGMDSMDQLRTLTQSVWWVTDTFQLLLMIPVLTLASSCPFAFSCHSRNSHLPHRTSCFSPSPWRNLFLPHMHSSRVCFFKLQLEFVSSAISKTCSKLPTFLDYTILPFFDTYSLFNRAFGSLLIMPRLLQSSLSISPILYHTLPGNYSSSLVFKSPLFQLAKLSIFNEQNNISSSHQHQWVALFNKIFQIFQFSFKWNKR